MNIKNYLTRIAFKDAVQPDEKTFIQLHKLHVLNVPFENLDIQNNSRIILEEKHLTEKIVNRSRGGFCYELNYLFHLLLRKVGFDAKMVSARIFDEGKPGPEFDHMAIIVRLNGRIWLADVGFGDLFINPLNIKEGIQKDLHHNFRIKKKDDKDFLLLMQKEDGSFEKKYRFDLRERRIEDFFDQCHTKQYNKNSYFVKNKVCTIAIPCGRKTIFNSSFIVRQNGLKKTVQIKTEEQEHRILKEQFQIQLNSPNT